MNEGFRSLPEDVQKKILGKAMGGVMQRPLFRQMGGPAQPMPQDMMPPAEPTAQAEMQGQAVGEEVAARTMGNIDAALRPRLTRFGATPLLWKHGIKSLLTLLESGTRLKHRSPFWL